MDYSLIQFEIIEDSSLVMGMNSRMKRNEGVAESESRSRFKDSPFFEKKLKSVLDSPWFLVTWNVRSCAKKNEYLTCAVG